MSDGPQKQSVKSVGKLHMIKTSYDGYCVGVGVEYPGIVVSAESDDELRKEFIKVIPSYERAVQKYGTKDPNVEVIPIDRRQVAK